MTAIQKPVAEPAPDRPASIIFAIVAGIFFFVAIVKFGNPIILDHLIQPPENFGDAIYESWPARWAIYLMAPVVVAGLAAIRWNNLNFKWPLALPFIWLAWQILSASQTVNRNLTSVTVAHFTVCVVLFYLGCFGLRGMRNPWPVWAGMALALCWLLRMGIEQHAGGLEATRQYIYQMKDSANIPPEILNSPNFLRRIAKGRIFASFSSPDGLAGIIELLLPLTLVFLWQLTPKVRTTFRWVFVAILGGAGLGCLYWTRSKGGWLVALVMIVIAGMRSNLEPKRKWILLGGLVVLGFAGFGIQYRASFNQQSVSVVTRTQYWRAALRIAEEHPLLGTGPGTFSVPYQKIVNESSQNNPAHAPDDFARLCHNDFLEQASDSGFPGFLAYTMAIIGCLFILYRYRIAKSSGFTLFFAAWLGVVGLSLHSAVEYHLYFPALAWPTFFLLGWMMGL